VNCPPTNDSRSATNSAGAAATYRRLGVPDHVAEHWIAHIAAAWGATDRCERCGWNRP